ncbi:hypothetical protein Airi01_098560 [Actinoallomurus iriomotensis]|uniref:Uncharacterized protein n=1 Tax=Actinoallomurus iriomotensis TaxID=478107 RepID=A0A9W6RTL0_9ACTN|nr:hypothetical protein Airi01_098560 [Actinoallomurus iriomotensis]
MALARKPGGDGPRGGDVGPAVDGDGEAVPRQPRGHGRADAPRTTGDERTLSGHAIPPWKTSDKRSVPPCKKPVPPVTAPMEGANHDEGARW